MRHTLVIGKRHGQVVGTHHDRIVVVARPVRRIVVRNVRDAQQNLAQGCFDLVRLGGKTVLAGTQVAALHHQRFGTCRVARLAQGADLLGDVVDLATHFIAFDHDVAQSGIKPYGVVDLFEEVRLGSTRDCRPYGIGGVAQQTDVDHRMRRLPVLSPYAWANDGRRSRESQRSLRPPAGGQ